MIGQLICDRCKKSFIGYWNEDCTAGYYNTSRVRPNNPWAKYANENEIIICDSCMWKDERYLKDYPHMQNQKETEK